MSHTTNGRLKETLSTTELTARERERLLNTDRSRLALDVLSGQTTSMKLEKLAAEIVARENDVDSTEENAIKRVAITLRYDHLPQMAELGILDYDSEANLIEVDEGRL